MNGKQSAVAFPHQQEDVSTEWTNLEGYTTLPMSVVQARSHRIEPPPSGEPLEQVRDQITAIDIRDEDASERCYPRVIPLPKSLQAQEHFDLRQKWEGVVMEVREDSFVARLYDQTTSGPIEEAEIPVSEVTVDDQTLIEPGAVFYWSIGYLVREGGMRSRATDLFFRRLPLWTRRELRIAGEEAERMMELFEQK